MSAGIKEIREQLAWLVKSFVQHKTSKKVLMFRQAEALGEYSGTLIGWTDSKLTVLGRKQANALYGGLYQHLNDFDGIYSSDLSRCYDTANIACGFKKTKQIIVDKRLRERNFGKDEGVHYDSLPESHKALFEDFTYKPEGGETWEEVRKRSEDFFADLKNPGNYLLFTHGGVICANSYPLGKTDVISNASCVAFELDNNDKAGKILFSWDLPELPN